MARKPVRARVPKPEADWAARDALHTLTRAEEIRRDPKLMARVQQHALRQRDALGKIVRAPRAK